MKRGVIFLALIISVVVEVVVSVLLLNQVGDTGQDTIEINRYLKVVEEEYKKTKDSPDGDLAGSLEKLSDPYTDALIFTVLDNEDNVLYKNDPKAATSINEAIRNHDTILNLTVDGSVVGRMVFFNDTETSTDKYRMGILVCISITSVIQLLIIMVYLLYLNWRVIRPFDRMKDFAARVAGGDLDIPLDMDRGHAFGNFTESFDLMRTELKKARMAEKQANDEKKEVIAKLSHDIKTPVASIKSTSEIGYELAKEDRVRDLFNTVNIKSDQITTLVDNLFNSSIQDITEIAVSPAEYPSDVVTQAIKNADYMKKADRIDIPSCHVFVDKLRLQQAFDNVFMNSYKYAGTDIRVEAWLSGGQALPHGDTVSDTPRYLVVRVSDSGEGVSAEELPLLKEKYHRGSNIAEREGAGLGLFLTDYFITKMDGYIELTSENGFAVTFYLRTCD